MKKYISILVCVSFVALAIIFFYSSCSRNECWRPLFNGSDLPPFHHYLGRPDSSVFVEGLKKDSAGNYTGNLGWSDPLNVYSVAILEGEPVIRISGQVIGGLVLADSVADFHLKLKFRWGTIKWGWMKGRPKDGGILYSGTKGGRHEFQIHEGDVGSYWAKNVIVDIPSVYTRNLPEAIVKAKPFLKNQVSTLNDSMLIFDPDAPLHHFEGRDEWQIVIANPYNEKPHGEWNELELICYRNHAVHIVNGKVNVIVLNSYIIKGEDTIPMNSGRLVLQSEGAEIYFKDIYFQKVTSMPEELKNYIK